MISAGRLLAHYLHNGRLAVFAKNPWANRGAVPFPLGTVWGPVPCHRPQDFGYSKPQGNGFDGGRFLLPRCYQSIPYQGQPRASWLLIFSVFVRVWGLLGALKWALRATLNQ